MTIDNPTYRTGRWNPKNKWGTMELKIFQYKCPDINNNHVALQVLQTLKSIQFNLDKGCSIKLREIISEELRPLGWSSKVKLSYKSQISITAMNRDCALCLQTGNVSRIYADLLKLEYLYKKEKTNLAIYILPTKKNARMMGGNLAYYERLIEELQLFSEIISIPILVLGID